MSKQKTVVVAIPHSENGNFTQKDNRQGDEACMDTQRDFPKTCEVKIYFCRLIYLGVMVALFLIFTSL